MTILRIKFEGNRKTAWKAHFIVYFNVMQRFFVNPKNVSETALFIDDEYSVHQIKRVLRMNIGDKIIGLDGSGREFLCEIKGFSDNIVETKIIENKMNANEPGLFVRLFQAMPKKRELFELVLQKGTEIGVSVFVPLITKHTEREDISNFPRLEKILCEAAEQCERGIIPKIQDAIKFEKYEKSDAIAILLHSRGDYPPLSTFVAEAQKIGKCDIFIGPEGGFSEDEVTFASSNGIKIASLGKRILRTETAAIVAAAKLLI